MCVVALSLRVHPDWPILLIGNRDEFHARASAPLAAWSDCSGIIAGRDLVGGGTWLGVHPAARRLAVLTNVRDAAGPDPAKRSRGELVTAALTGAAAAAPGAYNGYSLLSVDGDAATLSSNRPVPKTEALLPGVHAFANQPLGRLCPRADRLRAAFAVLDSDALCDDDILFALLRAGHDCAYAPGIDAPDQPFLTHATYGTRASTIVRIGADGGGRITERGFDARGAATGTRTTDFIWG